jgi:hypothetical protein
MMRPGWSLILAREHGESESQHQSLVDRIGRSELRMTEINAALTEGDLGRARLEENLGTIRAHLAEFEVEQESARETRVRWQVQEAHVAARVQAATERLERASNVGREAEQLTLQLTSELDQLDADTPLSQRSSSSGRSSAPSAVLPCWNWKPRRPMSNWSWRPPKTRCSPRKRTSPPIATGWRAWERSTTG